MGLCHHLCALLDDSVHLVGGMASVTVVLVVWYMYVPGVNVNASRSNGRFFTLPKLYYSCKIAMYYTTEAMVKCKESTIST